MNEQMLRLYEAAKLLRKIEGQSQVAKYLNISPQRLNNWEERGISNEGLLKAQEIIGCNAIWLRDGVGDIVRTSPENTTNAPPSLGLQIIDKTKLGLVYVDLDELVILTNYREATENGRDSIRTAAMTASKKSSLSSAR